MVIPRSAICRIWSLSNTVYIVVAISGDAMPELASSLINRICPAFVEIDDQFASGTFSKEKPKINLLVL